MSICASADLLSQPLAMFLFYACSAQIGSCRTDCSRGDAPGRAICHSVCMLLRLVILFSSTVAPLAQMRPPAVPLVAHDPYFSVWSMSDTLNGDATRHWTGKANSMTAYARIDSKPYRVMGR